MQVLFASALRHCELACSNVFEEAIYQMKMSVKTTKYHITQLKTYKTAKKLTVK